MNGVKPPRTAMLDICRDARTRSESLKETLSSASKKKRNNYCNIISVCEHLLTTRPISEPTAEQVAGLGATLFPYFPAKQTLNNQYSSLLNIWRCAYADILRLKPRRATLAKLAIPDQQFFEREIGVLRAEIKLLETDLARARAILANQTANVQDQPVEKAAAAVAIQLVRNWLRDIKEMRALLSPLEFTPAGLKISSRARPGMVIMKPELVQVIEAPL